MDQDRLAGGRRFVGNARGHGLSDAEIREALLESGWDEETIAALSASLAVPLGGAEKPPLPPAPPPPEPVAPPSDVELPPRAPESASFDVEKLLRSRRRRAERRQRRAEEVERPERPATPAPPPPEIPAAPPPEPEPEPMGEPEAGPAPEPEPVAEREPEPAYQPTYRPRREAEPEAAEEPEAPPECEPESEPEVAAAREEPATPAGPPERPPSPPTAPAPPSSPRRRPSMRPDIEVAIGTAWLTRIGMVAVILAVAYLLGWAYNEGHISPSMLVGAGVLAGILVMAGGEFAHGRGYEIQSQALTGGGAGLLYLTLWAALGPYDLIDTGVAFPAMALVTAAAAVQAVRHRSETVATLAWITGYAVPLLIHSAGTGGGGGGGDAPALFAYLTLLSLGVFVVAQRHAWPAFTGLALMGAYSSGAYIFRVSDGALGWTLTYLMLVTAGMMWVSVSRKGREGENFGAVGAVAGYLVTGVVLLANSSGSPFVPYMYLLALSGAALFMGHTHDWRSLRWLGALGSFAGFLLLLPVIRRTGLEGMGEWMLLYSAVSVTGVLAISSGRRTNAEPLAITAVIMAYVTAAILVWGSAADALSHGAVFVYLLLLAAGVMAVKALIPWTRFAVVGTIAAFLATGLLCEAMPGGPAHFGLLYLALVGAAALGVSAWRNDLTHGVISIVGIFLALPMTGMMSSSAPVMVAPVYLAVAAIASLVAIDWRRWWGYEWVVLIGTWGMYLIWRGTAGLWAPAPAHVNFTVIYLLAFVVEAWMRHGARGDWARPQDAALACINAAAFFAIGAYDVHETQAAGLVALGLMALYALAGVTGIRRRPAQTWFGSLLLGLSVFFLTVAVPLLTYGHSMTLWWAAEVMLLLGLSFGFRARGLRDGALVVLTLPLLRAIGIDSQIAREGYQVIANPRALAMFAVIAAMYIGGYLYWRFGKQLSEGERRYSTGLISFASVLLLWICSAEAWSYVGWQLGMDRAAQQFALSGVWVLFGAALLVIGVARDLVAPRGCALTLFAMTIFKVLAVDPLLTQSSYLPLLHHRVAPLIAITALLYATAAWLARTPREEPEEPTIGPTLVGVATGLLLWIASSETWLFVGWGLGLGHAAQHFALSGVWVVFGAALLAIGIARDQIALRWAALGLLGVTVLKVFAGEPALHAETYLPIINAHAAPLLAIAIVLFVASRWYRRSEYSDPSERDAGAVVLVVATVLLLWVLSAEAWLATGWTFGRGEVAQYAALSAVWIIFSLVLLLLGVERDSAPLRWSGLALLGLTALKVLSLEPPLTQADYVPLLNTHAGPLIVVTVVVFLVAAWFARTKESGTPEATARTALLVAATGLLLWVASTESWHFLGWRTGAGLAGQQMSLSLIWLIFGAVMLVMGMDRDSVPLRALGFTAVGLVVAKVLLIDQALSMGNYRLLANHQAFPLLLAAATLYLASYHYRHSDVRIGESERAFAGAMPYVASALVWWVLTTEAWHFTGWTLQAAGDAQQYALSMVWTIFGAILITVGLVRGNPPLRWIAMGLLAVTVGKVFFLDLRAMEVFYRILALAGLGVALIIVGFVYQRLVREQTAQATPGR